MFKKLISMGLATALASLTFTFTLAVDSSLPKPVLSLISAKEFPLKNIKNVKTYKGLGGFDNYQQRNNYNYYSFVNGSIGLTTEDYYIKTEVDICTSSGPAIRGVKVGDKYDKFISTFLKGIDCNFKPSTTVEDKDVFQLGGAKVNLTYYPSSKQGGVTITGNQIELTAIVHDNKITDIKISKNFLTSSKTVSEPKIKNLKLSDVSTNLGVLKFGMSIDADKFKDFGKTDGWYGAKEIDASNVTLGFFNFYPINKQSGYTLGSVTYYSNHSNSFKIGNTDIMEASPAKILATLGIKKASIIKPDSKTNKVYVFCSPSAYVYFSTGAFNHLVYVNNNIAFSVGYDTGSSLTKPNYITVTPTIYKDYIGLSSALSHGDFELIFP